MTRDFVTDLDTKLARIGHSSHLTMRMATENIISWGGPGSGKTSGSGKAIAGALLRAGCGGLVLTAKFEEIQLWIDYARAHGREKHVVLFTETKGFNFIDWELARNGAKGVANVTESIMRVLEAADHAMGTGGKSNEPFWEQGARQRLNFTLPLLYSAYGNVTVSDILSFGATTAAKPQQYTEAAFIESSFAARTMRKAVDGPAVRMEESELKTFLEFWFNEHTRTPDKTRGNVDITLSAKLDRLRHGRLHDMFCGRTTLCPEMLFHGAIIIMCCPVLRFGDEAVIAQQLFKYCTQKAIESRNGLDPRQQQRPLFIFGDEFQYFYNSYDDTFVSTSRSTKTAVVCLSQSLATLHSRAGKDKTDAVDGFVGKFGTQIFHLNTCNKTNSYASQLVGRDLQWRTTQGQSSGTNTSRGMNEGASANRGSSSGTGHSYGGNNSSWNTNSGTNHGSGENFGANVGTGTNESRNYSEAQTMDAILEPRYFASALKSGGPRNKGIVTAVLFRAGARFEETGSNWLTVAFRQ